LARLSAIWLVNPLNGDKGMNIKQQVQDFYNQVGWREISEGVYQNATFEDLRPVSREYIHRCHLRVLHHLQPQGKYLLDAGSGPIQYPEYLEYSKGYQYRVCADISIVALQEARKRIGEKGLFVVADIAHLPFRAGMFEAVVSLHTIHHLPLDEHIGAYTELQRVLSPGCSAVVVNGWKNPPIERWVKFFRRLKSKILHSEKIHDGAVWQQSSKGDPDRPAGKTFVSKYDATWFKHEIGSRIPARIWVWRSLSVGLMRKYIHENRLGVWLLRMVYLLEELFPHFFGKIGVYPLITIRKPDRS
jgi:ubiquinone/menaquinone biosynthesis C-methylase UbiE